MDTLLEGKLKEHPGRPAGLPQASYLSSSEICQRLILLLEGYYCLRHTSGRIPAQKKLFYIALNKTQSSRCFGHHCDIGVPISDCIHWQSMNNKVADNFILPRVIGTSLSLLSSGRWQSTATNHWARSRCDLTSSLEHTITLLPWDASIPWLPIYKRKEKQSKSGENSPTHQSWGTAICWGGHHPTNSSICHNI